MFDRLSWLHMLNKGEKVFASISGSVAPHFNEDAFTTIQSVGLVPYVYQKLEPLADLGQLSTKDFVGFGGAV